MALDAGTRLGSYEIVAPVGAGSMGEVYRAKDPKLGRDVAIKVLPKALAADADRLRRFEQEARAASSLNHPNIVHVYDIDQVDDHHYIVMELVDGVTLRQLLAEAPFENQRLVDLGRQLGAGLAKAHGAGIVHRDLKPENLMVTDDGFLKILDFGLAKLSEALFEGHSEMSTLVRQGTRQGMLIGTVEYMSPEQASAKAVDHRSDQFAVGLILYEMATGRLAFQRETAAQTLASIIESDPPAVAVDNASCPDDFVRIVTRCLQKKPEDRYADTRELVRAMDDVRLDRVVASVPPPPPPPPPSPERPIVRGIVGGEWVNVRSRDGRVRQFSERRFRRRLRKSRYAGDELIRVGDSGEWTPLYESHIFRREVPYEGDPETWVFRRKAIELAEHAGVFVAFGAAWFAFRGEVPLWMGWWGFGLAMHGMNVAPVLLRRLRNRELSGQPAEAPALDAPATRDEGALIAPSFAEEVTRVKKLLGERGGEDAAALVAEVDGIVARAGELARMDRDLAEQTSPDERSRLEQAVAEAERKVQKAGAVGDRELYERQLVVLRSRKSAIDKALEVVERLRTRIDVTEQQVKQLRLDLSRAAASRANVPELSSRLQDIRHEIDATERVDEAIAQELLS